MDGLFLYGNGIGKIVVDGVSTVLDGNDAAALLVRNDGDRLAGVAAQREQKRIQLLVVGFDTLNDVFDSFLCGTQRHVKISLWTIVRNCS